MCLRGRLREMHTLIERPPGQRKYLRENENFILAVFSLYGAALDQTIKSISAWITRSRKYRRHLLFELGTHRESKSSTLLPVCFISFLLP